MNQKLKKRDRIYILGPPGAGTTYLSNKISKILNIPPYDTDDVRFIKKFTKARTKKKRKKIMDKIIRRKKWIIDARGTDWDRHAMLKADLIVWINTPPLKRVFRIIKRFYKRRKNKELEEKFQDLFPLTKYSLNYKYGSRSTSFKSISNFLSENKIKPVIIKNDKQLNKLLGNLK